MIRKMMTPLYYFHPYNKHFPVVMIQHFFLVDNSLSKGNIYAYSTIKWMWVRNHDNYINTIIQ